MKHLFIINPVAGKGRTLELIPEIEKLFAQTNEEHIIEITKYKGHATEIAQNYVNNHFYRVYCVGGDGTVNEVLNGMAGSNNSLAVIPAGSGNDFFRSINKHKDLEDVLLRTFNGEEKWMDIAKVNGRYFINIASAGFDAETVCNTQLTKKIPFISGSAAYIMGVLLTVIKNKSYKVDISYDGKKFSGKLLLCAIANGRYYGGGILPAPEAKLDDGLLDICLVHTMGRFKILKLFPKYMKGEHTGMKEVHITKAEKIEIYSKNVIPLNVDGEVWKDKHALFEIIPKGIKIVIPK